MKRVFPNKVNPAPECEADANATAGLVKPSNTEGHLRVCSSVAKIGLAISVGASSILLPGQSNSAVAADRDVAKSPATLAPSAKDKAMAVGVTSVESPTDIASAENLPTLAHTVASGETLWQLAQIYQIDAAIIANANGMGVDAALKVGQVLYIPSEQDVASDFELAERAIASATLRENSKPQGAARFKRSLQFSETATEIERTPTSSALLSSTKLETFVPRADVNSIERQETERPETISSVAPGQSSAALGLETEKPLSLSRKNIPTLSASAIHPNLRSHPSAALHRVRDGETLYEIARQYNISARELANVNGLSDPSFIRVGQQIDIPPGATLKPQTSLTVFGTKVTSKPSTLEESVPRISLPADNSTSATIELALLDTSTVSNAAGVPNLVVSQSEKAIDESETEDRSWVALDEGSLETAERLAAKLKTGSGNQASANTDTREYVEELRAGIDKLRAKHRIRHDSNPSGSVPETVVAASNEDSVPSARQINPEFAPEQHATALETEGLQPWSQSQTQVEASEEAEEFVMAATLPEEVIEENKVSLDPTTSEASSEVAVAPLGSNNYAPIDPPRMVSPELPSLSAPQAYLPKVQPGTWTPGMEDFTGAYTWPAQGELSSGYGWRWGRMHQGIDIAGPVGTPIVAAGPGVVSYSRWNSGGYGNLVEITHPDGTITLYGHNSRLLVNEGEEVEQGQQIAEMGSTGYSTGPHVHFEIHPPGVGAVDPIAYLQ